VVVVAEDGDGRDCEAAKKVGDALERVALACHVVAGEEDDVGARFVERVDRGEDALVGGARADVHVGEVTHDESVVGFVEAFDAEGGARELKPIRLEVPLLTALRTELRGQHGGRREAGEERAPGHAWAARGGVDVFGALKRHWWLLYEAKTTTA
jgi:hypothetical protein